MKVSVDAVHASDRCERCLSRARRRLEAVRGAMGRLVETDDGRQVLDFILDQTGLNAITLWEGSSKINVNVARRDFGAELQAELLAANSKGYFALLSARLREGELEMRAQLEDERLLLNEKRKER